jgi:predicted phosphoribosyltransferase
MSGGTGEGFADRDDAGRRLARAVLAALADLAGPAGPAAPAAAADGGDRPVVLALPRGGVPVAAPVAAALRAPLDVLVVRKLAEPGRPELGLGALAEDGEPLWNVALLRELGLWPDDLADVVADERAELRRRVASYRGDRPPEPVAGRTVVVVDDGLATGLTALAAVRHVQDRGAARVVLAAPVAAAPSADALRASGAEVVALLEPRRLRSVGEWYADFTQVPDGVVTGVLATFDR